MTLSFLLVVGLELPSWGQFTIPGLTTSGSSRPPTGVVRQGNIEAAPVWFDGEILFAVTAPTVRDRDNPGDLLPVEMRVELIQANLRRALFTDVSFSFVDALQLRYPKPDNVVAGVALFNGETIITVRTNEQQRPQKILTVTETDADFYSLAIPDLAAEWQKKIQVALREAAAERAPDALISQLSRACQILVLMASLSLGVLILQRLLTLRLQSLKQAYTQAPLDSPEPNPTPPPTGLQRFFQLLPGPELFSSEFDLKDKHIKFLKLIQFLLTWSQAALWLGGTFLILHLFPWTRFFALQVLGLPIWWLVIWFLGGLANSLGDIALERMGTLWHRYPVSAETDLQRRHLRISTALKVFAGLKTTLIYAIALGLIVNSVGIPVVSVIAIGGLLAFALSLGAQSLVRDLINGAFILWEDQFGIGDVVAIGAVSGAVENMNLRITQLRNGEGRLITIPNSAISVVENLTRTWSRVDFTIDIDPKTPADQALDCLKQVTTQLYTEPAWQEQILEPPEVLGIEQLTHSGLTIRIWIKTKPGRQWAVGRELRQRVQRTMLKMGLEIGRPQQTLFNQQNGKINGPSPQPTDQPS
ncbi:mechanosensitive ion channel family protein [Thermosynechococcaceae cyanobacterium BACA0444]|uniref:Mechanosensitive ion channel family protein n=1 Tax=Pseudocalidococcus azoricus BACA0444 TaxID=2918990 RepID=A0AAE4FSE7_9CYAN|nr:mechanosensitive ion channel family protein [Pseudocalidococcus azoricus]MDS3861468.1 mechanosensitive ion channel family protein [Pseudocalidococcus azoricus BACA0444]